MNELRLQSCFYVCVVRGASPGRCPSLVTKPRSWLKRIVPLPWAPDLALRPIRWLREAGKQRAGRILDGRPQAGSLSRRLRFELQENTITVAVFLRNTDRDA